MSNDNSASALLIVIGAVFLVAGGRKALQGDAASQLNTFREIGLPDGNAIGMLVQALPGIEVCVAIWLFIGWRTDLALVAVGLLLLAFLSVILQALRKGYRGSCFCFGDSTAKFGISSLFFNGIIFACTLFSMFHVFYRGGALKSILEADPISYLMALFIGIWLMAITALVRQVEEVHRTLRDNQV